jgi:amino acid transporter
MRSEKAGMRIIDVLLGRPIRTAEDATERVGPLRGVAILGLDALGSAAYGPEALLTVLLPLGAGGLRYLGLLMIAIVGLLILLSTSYWQTISAYPNGGGAYTVTRENLGTLPSLGAAAALLLDYLLNVAVAISAGVAALVSAVPALLPFTLVLCLAVLGLLTLINLRGLRSTGAAILLPTYAFVGCMFTLLVVGLLHGTEHAAPAPLHAVAPAALGPTALTWLLVRAFANGCTAMTGVEAVSNGVPIFYSPSASGGRKTLLLIVGILIILLAGIAVLCNVYGILAKPPGQAGYESILSQLAAAVFGRGALYYLTIGSIISVLALSANTSFADFPRVCGLLANDRFLPEPFSQRGRRLTFSHGILLLSGLSALLLCLFGGITDRLIPLFALGALGAFTMSQVGMVRHWRKQRGAHARLASFTNLLGALATGLTLCCVLLAKFSAGAWVTLILVGAMLATFLAVRRHYDFIERAIHTAATLEIGPLEPALAVVPMRTWQGVSLKALRLAMSLSPRVCVLQILTRDRHVDDLRPRWRELAVLPTERLGLPTPELVVKESEYRQVLEPVLDAVREIARQHPDRAVLVVLPELVEARWYHSFLHSHTGAMLAHRLKAQGGKQVVIVRAPWHLRDWVPERHWLLRFRPLARRVGPCSQRRAS